MPDLDNPNKQKPREKIHVTLGELGENIESMRRGLVELWGKIVVNEKELERLQEKNEGTSDYRAELADRIKNDRDTFRLESEKHMRVLGQYRRRESQLQKIKNRGRGGK